MSPHLDPWLQEQLFSSMGKLPQSPLSRLQCAKLLTALPSVAPGQGEDRMNPSSDGIGFFLQKS